PPKPHASACFPHLASLVPDLDDLGVVQLLGSSQPWFRLATHFPATAGTIHPPNDLEQCRRIGLPPIREKEWELAGAHYDLRDQRGCRLLSPRSKVDPQEEPTAHGQCRMHPFHLFGTQFGMCLIQLHTQHLHVLHALLMVLHGPLSCHPLKAMHSLEIHGT